MGGQPVTSAFAAAPAWLIWANAFALLAWIAVASRERPPTSASDAMESWRGLALPSGRTKQCSVMTRPMAPLRVFSSY